MWRRNTSTRVKNIFYSHKNACILLHSRFSHCMLCMCCNILTSNSCKVTERTMALVTKWQLCCDCEPVKNAPIQCKTVVKKCQKIYPKLSKSCFSFIQKILNYHPKQIHWIKSDFCCQFGPYFGDTSDHTGTWLSLNTVLYKSSCHGHRSMILQLWEVMMLVYLKQKRACLV